MKTTSFPLVFLGLMMIFGACQEPSPTSSLEHSAAVEQALETHAIPDISNVPANQALDRLLEGNRRFVNEQALHPHCDSNRIHEVVAGQHPFAIVIACADSRVPPELLFDQGIGDLFVIRNAGHVITNSVLGSVEYAVHYTGVELVLVLGHENCGAVTAAAQGMQSSRHIMEIEESLMPAVNAAKKHHGNLIDLAVRENVRMAVDVIRSDPYYVPEAISSGHLRVVGARYDLDDGQVSIIYDPVPTL